MRDALIAGFLNYKDDLSKSEAQQADTQKQLDNLKSNFSKLRQSDDQLKADLQNTISADKAQIALLSQQLADAQKARTDIAAKLQEAQDNLEGVEKQSQHGADEDQLKKQELPLPIVEALNDMVNSVNTGISRNDYSLKLISLKNAAATYGSGLSPFRANSLATIISNYNTALVFWNKSQIVDGVPTISLLSTNVYDKPEEELLGKLGIPYESQSVGDSPFRVYSTTAVLSTFWKTAGDDITQFLKTAGSIAAP